MHSVDVTQYHALLDMERKLCGMYGKFLIRSTPAFSALAVRPDANTINEHLQQLEHFVVLVFDRTSTDVTVNEARKILFSQKGRSMDNLPPTQAALVEYIKRAAYQTGHVWAQMLVASPKLSSPKGWGLEKNTSGGWEVTWTELLEASQACYELVKCSCKKDCIVKEIGAA